MYSLVHIQIRLCGVGAGMDVCNASYSGAASCCRSVLQQRLTIQCHSQVESEVTPCSSLPNHNGDPWKLDTFVPMIYLLPHLSTWDFFFFEVLVIPNQPQTHYIAKGDFELLIFLPLISPDPRLQACATVLGLCNAVDLVQDFVLLSYVFHPHALHFSISGLINGPSLVSFTGQSYWLISLVSWKCLPPIGFSLPVPEIPPCDLAMMLSLV